MLSTKQIPPIAFFIFNRPDTTRRVFEEIRRSRPSTLLVVADGPRPDHPGEAEKCLAVRDIIDQVDWPCDLRKNYSESNLGCKTRVSSGLDWVFEMEENAIILEDDCLPQPTFFRFCGDILDYYKDDKEIMHISGDNFLQGKNKIETSYYFSKYAHVWGWATWRRSWILFHEYDHDFERLDLDFRIFKTQSERNFWAKLLEQLRTRQMDYTWDYQWALICLSHKALCAMPKSNMVSNIGFGQGATHTQNISWLASLPTLAMDFPLRHPINKTWDYGADSITSRIFFNVPSKSIFTEMKSFLHSGKVTGIKKK
jgi:hypothetical protein